MIPSRLKDLDSDLVERGWEWECVKHGFEWTLSADKEEIGRIGELALRGENESGVGVGVIYGSRTVGYFEETVEMIRGWWKEDEERGEGRRGKRVIESVEGTNHFGFVHKPEDFFRVLSDCIDDLM